MKALILVDIQNDFLPGGALAVPNGDEIIPIVDDLLGEDWAAIVASKDWHPPGHSSFVEQGGPWPPHCVQGTKGAELALGFDHSLIDYIVFKGTDPADDGYSAFSGTDLNEYLKKEGITDLTVVGLATDHCVKATVLDALSLGYGVKVFTEGVRGLDNADVALHEMQEKGAHISSIDETVF